MNINKASSIARSADKILQFVTITSTGGLSEYQEAKSISGKIEDLNRQYL